MFATKHTALSEKIASAIKAGVYVGKLPTQRELQQEYQVSLQTINKALRPLVQQRLISPSPQGSMINFNPGNRPEYHTWGIMCNRETTPEDTRDSLYIQRILTQKDHYNLLYVNGANPKLEDISAWESLPVDGLVFGFMTLNEFRAAAVRRAGIPAVAQHYVDPDFGIHSVGFDYFTAIEVIVQRLLASGYRRIALQLLQPISWLRHAREKWVDILKRHNVYFPEYEYPVLKEFSQFDAHLQAHNRYLCQHIAPEVVICWHRCTDQVISELRQLSRNKTLLGVSFLSPEQAPGQFFPVTVGNLYEQQWQLIHQVLQEARRSNNHEVFTRSLAVKPNFLFQPPPPGTAWNCPPVILKKEDPYFDELCCKEHGRN